MTVESINKKRPVISNRSQYLNLVTLSEDKRLNQALHYKSSYICLNIKKEMKFEDFSLYFSTSRVNRYLNASGNSKSRAVKLYKANLRVSQAFHPLLGVLEVIFRNRLNDALSSYFSDPEWIVNQKTGFMIDQSLTFVNKRSGRVITNNFLLTEVEKAERNLNRTGTPITTGKIIAEQNLGFWTDFFAIHHYRLLKGKPIHIFKTLPVGYGRKEVKAELDNIRRFRNRVNHNEPVCFNGNTVDFSHTIDVHHSIIKILSWIDPAILQFISDLDKVNGTIASARKI